MYSIEREGKDILCNRIEKLLIENGMEYDNRVIEEIHFRCDWDIDDDGFFLDEPEKNVDVNIQACIGYIKDNGFDALVDEDDDGEIWEYV